MYCPEILNIEIMNARQSIIPLILLLFLVASGCKKETIIVPDNTVPWYDEVPTIVIENYVNRMYIDLIGREPLDPEMAADVEYLKQNHLSLVTRDSLLRKLQLDSAWVSGDSSYRFAYFHRLYDMSKVRLLEGASDADFGLLISNALQNARVDSLQGDSLNMAIMKARAAKMQLVLDSELNYRQGRITAAEMTAYMVNNSVYDQINMNTFNFVNATFNDLFFRYPTTAEYDQAFNMIEYNVSGILFGTSGQNKGDYVQIITGSREFYEGMIRWAYLTLLAREPLPAETYELMTSFYFDNDFQKVQRHIMKGDEYAQFE